MTAHVKAATVCPSGKMLMIEFADGAGEFTALIAANYATTETVRCDGAAGTYALTLAGHTTAPLARSAGSAAVQSALEALTGIGAGNVTVLGIPGRFLVRFAGTLAAVPQALLSVDTSGLLATGPTPPTTAGTSPHVSIDSNAGSPGYVVTGDWLGGGFGGKKFQSSGTGANYATWTFTGLAAGLYRVSALWDVDALNTTAARYRFFDGANYRGSAVVDQTVDRTADNPDSTQTLKVVYVAGGTLTVHLADDTTGFIRANVVAIYPTSTASSATTETVAGSTSFVASGGDVSAKLNGSPLPLVGANWHVPYYTGDPFGKPYVFYPISGTVVDPIDSVTVSVPGGVFTTSAGVVTAAVTDLAASNTVGGVMGPPLPTTARTLRLGWNLGFPAPHPVGMYSNLMKAADGWLGAGFTTDGNGYPVFTAAGSTLCVVVSSGGNIADPRGYPSGCYGDYTVYWDSDGGGSVELRTGSGGLVTLLSSDTGHTTNNKRVYRVEPDPDATAPIPYFAGLICNVVATVAGTPAVNIRIYPPDVDASTPPKFRPIFLEQCGNAKILRTMPTLGANNSSISEYSEYGTQGQRSYYSVDSKATTYAIATIGPYTDTTNFVPAGKLPMLVTLTQAHTIKTGKILVMIPAAGKNLQIPMHGGGSTQFDYYSMCPYYEPAFMTDHQFVIWGDTSTGTPTYVDPVFTDGGTVVTNLSQSIPPEDYIDLINALDDCEAYINVPHCATDALVTQLFTMVRDRFAAGRRIYCEVANEHWNYGPGFSQYQYFVALGQQLNGSGTTGYTVRSGHIHALARAALGSRASDFRGVFGGLSVVPSITTTIFDVAEAASPPIPVDAITFTGYTKTYPNEETEPSIAAIGASLDSDQACDIFERHILSGYDANGILTHNATRLARSPSTEMMVYEGGMTTGFTGGDGFTRARQSQAVSHHPRMVASLMRLYQSFQDVLGVTRFTYYAHTHEYANEGSTNVTVYGGYQSWNMVDGTNDGTGGGYDVRPDIAGVPPGPADLSRSKSVIGQSVRLWNAGVDPAEVGPGTGGGGSVLASGTLSAGTPTASAVPITFGVVTGGTAPYSSQLQSLNGSGTWANMGSPVSGATASFTASGLTASTQYSFRVVTTDAASATVTSNTVTATTASGSSGGGPTSRTPRLAFRLPRS